MYPGSDEVLIIALNLLISRRLRLDVAIAVMAPLARQWVVFMSGRQGRILDQQ
jgi:hypothetical protein